MSGTNFSKGVLSFGVPVETGSTSGKAFGTTYFVDSTNGNDGNTGKGRDIAFKSLTTAFATVSSYDTIRIAPGGYTGNYSTPVNADAAFVSVIGDATHAQGLAVWMGATTASSPIIDVRARGWSFSGIEFDCPTSAAGIRLTKSTNGSTHRCDFTTISNCIFTTGKYGIEVNGGGTHVHIANNKFDQLTESGAFAIICLDTSNQLPAYWVVENNIFANCVNHIGPANATYGWSETTFRNNIHQADGVGQNVSTMMDIRGSSAGGNMVIGCYWDMTATEWETGNSDANIRTNSTDFGAGNECNDGPAEAVINV